ncbi:MAG: hypothetical protein RLZ71_81 [Actinomycetota bacterium]|jgi:hypothetical protein
MTEKAQTKPAKTSLLAKLKGLSKKTKIITASAVVVLLGVVGGTAYALYNSPEAVLGQAIGSLFGEKNPSYDLNLELNTGTISGSAKIDIATGDGNTQVDSTVTANFLGNNLGANLKIVADKDGNLYAKLSDFNTLTDFLVNAGQLPPSIATNLQQVLDANWIQVSKSEIDALTNNSSCIQDKLSDEAYAKAASKQVTDLLRSNFFVVIKKELPQENGNRVFEIGLSAEKLQAFLKGLKDTDFYGDLQSCYPTLEITNSQINDITQESLDGTGDVTPVYTVYADAFSHKLTKFTVVAEDTSNSVKLTFTPTGDKSSTVEVPQDSISFTELSTLLIGGTN